MGEIKYPKPVKLIVGMLSSKVWLFEEAEKRLSGRFGRIDFASQLITFNFTDYYEKELGKNIFRKFVSFEELVEPGELAEIKIFTNGLEDEFKDEKRNARQINLDPGYVDAAKLVLASVKDYQHRIYLGKGIYAEVTLRYTKGSFRPWEWTYPDYRTEEYIGIFNEIRGIYLGQVRATP